MTDATLTVEPRTATAAADDTLTVTGTVTLQLGDDTYSCEVAANGWYSATQQHYPPEHYADGENGPELVEGAQPRAMNADELAGYCADLLVEAFISETPLVKRTATNLLAPPAAQGSAPSSPEPQPEPAPAAAPATEPEPEQPAPTTDPAAPPMEGSPAPAAPGM